MLEMDVEGHGVGTVGKNIVVSIMTQKQARNFLQQKTIMMPFVVDRKRDLSKNSSVLEDVQVIVLNDGNLNIVTKWVRSLI